MPTPIDRDEAKRDERASSSRLAPPAPTAPFSACFAATTPSVRSGRPKRVAVRLDQIAQTA